MVAAQMIERTQSGGTGCVESGTASRGRLGGLRLYSGARVALRLASLRQSATTSRSNFKSTKTLEVRFRAVLAEGGTPRLEYTKA